MAKGDDKDSDSEGAIRMWENDPWSKKKAENVTTTRFIQEVEEKLVKDRRKVKEDFLREKENQKGATAKAARKQKGRIK